MPEAFIYTSLIWDRARWVKERDSKDNGAVPKGAAKVSMGDTLDKFHKEAPKGAKAGHKAAEDLQKAVATYKAAIKTKYPKFHDLIEKKLEPNLKSYVDESKKVLDGVASYAALREKASTALLVAGAAFQQWAKNGSQGAFKPSNAKPLVDALTAFLTAMQKAIFYSDKVTKDAAKVFNQTVYATTAGVWSKATIEGLVEQLKKSPSSI